jgi:hypothetical protein
MSRARSDDRPICGKGLAANAVLPERFASLKNALAALLDNHVRALDPQEVSNRQMPQPGDDWRRLADFSLGRGTTTGLGRIPAHRGMTPTYSPPAVAYRRI